MNTWITLSIATLAYAGIAAGSWPGLRANRATIALMGAGLLLAAGQIRFDQIGQFLDLNTLILLFSMMILNANLQMSGFFRLAGGSLLRLAKTPRAFLAVEILLSGLLSAFFLNDTICLMFTPFILNMMLTARRNPLPYLIALATAANIGSTATLTGNPQNMIIGVASGIAYVDFSLALLPAALLGMGGIWLVLVWLYPDEFRAEAFDPALRRVSVYRPLLLKTLIIVAGLLAAFLAGVPVALASFLAACALLFTRRIRPEKMLKEIDWDLLVFFSALFIVTGSLEANGVSQWIFGLMRLGPETGPAAFAAITVILSNLVSNVPAVLLLRPVIPTLSDPRAGWLALAAASTLAGNLTLLGSVANLIVAEIARKRGVEMSFWEYTKAGALITLISLVTGIGWIALFVWR